MRQEVMAENLPPESFIPLPTSGNLINASAWPEEYLDGMMDGSPGCSAHNQVRGHFFREYMCHLEKQNRIPTAP